MKRIVILVVIVSLLLSFILTGCSENGTTATGLTDEEVSTIAMASLGSVMLPMMFASEEPPPDATYDGTGIFDGTIISGTLTVSDSGATFTFASCAMDVDEPPDGVADMTLGGGFSVAFDGTEMVFTYDDFNVVGTIPDTASTINIVVTGTFTITETEFTVDITISGIIDDPCAVVMVLPVPEGGGGPTEVTSATFDGVDYTEEVNAALAEFQ